MEKIKIRIIKPSENGIFHDTRGDVKKLAKISNLLIGKVNELVDEVEKLKAKQKQATTTD
tara:strand:+ start:231 stop:410 length:180 start_codon:yes stop_codon:yes gene_type:complete